MKKLIFFLCSIILLSGHSLAQSIVTNNNDNGSGSLRDVVTNAAIGNTITFSSSLSGQTITLTSGHIVINKDLTIDGSAFTNPVTISGNNTSRIFVVNNNSNFSLEGLTINDGNAGNGGAMLVSNSSNIIISNSTFSNNTGTIEGGAIRVSGGSTSIAITGSTFSGNTGGTFGSAISIATGTAIIENTTISGNSTTNGGAIFINGNVSLILNHSTIANNTGRGLVLLHATTTTHISNSIFANNISGDVVTAVGSSITTNNNSLCRSCSGLGFAIEGQNPLLNPLTNNGGATQTHSLQKFSPAINTAVTSALSTDQRGTGFIRSQDGMPDMGAFEALPFPPLVSTLSPLDDAINTTIFDDLILTFDEPIIKGTGNIQIYDAANNLFESIPVTDSKITVAGAVVAINPTNDLLENTSYYVQIAPTVFNDLTGNSFAGITNTTDWNFTTGSSFVTTWQTTTANETITIPTKASETYNYGVDWGDGTTTTSLNTSTAPTHTYSTAGIYTVSVSGLFPALYFNNSGDKNKILTIEQWGTGMWTTMKNAFFGCTNLTGNFTDTPMFIPNISLFQMFRGAASFNSDVSNWDVSNVANMRGMFREAADFNQNLNSWDVSNVINMRDMFNSAIAFNQNIASWNVARVKTMDGMFTFASNFNQNIGTWEVDSVTDMNRMFNGATVFNQDIGNWDVDIVTSMNNMFGGASAFDQNLGAWNVTNVTNMFNMFNGVTLSVGNYDALLIGWDSKILQNGIDFNGGNSQYCAGANARANMISSMGDNWTITDGGIYISTGTDIQAACDSYTWIDGNTYTSSNSTATHILTNNVGCDSIVTLNLTINNSTTGTDIQTACNSYTWIDGNTYSTSTNMPTVTLTNVSGCDSTIILNLTISSSINITDTQIACNTFTWTENGMTYTSSTNTPSVTYAASSGCDSIVTLNLTINSTDTTLTITDPIITSNAVGADYQWIDCNNGNSLITGETNQSFTASSNGNYAVEITKNGCASTSTCVQILSVGTEEKIFESQIVIYPNPTEGLFTVDMDGIANATLVIYNAVGQQVESQEVILSSNLIDLSNYDKGIYFVKIKSGETIFTKRILKN